jgi:hypothetical protein
MSERESTRAGLQTRQIDSVEIRALEGENTRKAELRAAVVGNLDSHRSVFFPGAFEGTTEDFVRGGHLLVAHNWDLPNIGMIESARQEGNALLATVHFYNTQAGNDMYHVLRERSAAGKTMGASIGFFIETERHYRDGRELLADAERMGVDLSLFDPALAQVDGEVWGIQKVKSLYEVSLVVAASNPLTEAMNVRQLKAAEELQLALDAVARVSERYRQIREIRVAEGRDLSPDKKAELAAAKASLDALSAQLADIVFDDSLPRATGQTKDSIAPRSLSCRIMANELEMMLKYI